MFGNSYINFPTKSTCLGVVIDHKLNWKQQVKTLHTKFGGKLKFLKRMKGLPPRVLEEIYYKSIAIWESCSLSIFNELEQSHIKGGTPDSDVLKLGKWKSLRVTPTSVGSRLHNVSGVSQQLTR